MTESVPSSRLVTKTARLSSAKAISCAPAPVRKSPATFRLAASTATTPPSFAAQRYLPSGCKAIRVGLAPALTSATTFQVVVSTTATELTRGMLTKSFERSPVSAQSSPGLLSMMSVTSFERSEEHTSELQSRQYLVCRLLLEK